MNLFSIILCIAASLPFQNRTGPADAATQPEAASPPRFSTFRTQLDGIGRPGGAAFDSKGRLLVTDSEGGFIRVYDAAGKEVEKWGGPGGAAAEFKCPQGIAVAGDGLVYIADSGNARILVLDGTGRMVRQWGQREGAKGGLITPKGLAVTASRVYVADPGQDRVLVFDLQGKFQSEFGGFGAEPGRMRRPMGVACDSGGRVYVADSDNCRIQRFSADGAFQTAWGQFGPFPGLLANPSGLCVHQGRVYVADTDNHRIQVFDAEGSLLDRWGVHALRPREGNGRMHYPSAVAVQGEGHVAAVVEAFADRCQLFGPFDPSVPPDLLATAGLDLSLVSHYGPYGDVDGDLMVLTEPESHSVQVMDMFTRDPILITRFGTYGGRAGQFVRPGGIAVDAKNSLVYVCDSGNRRLQVFRLDRKPGDEIRFRPTLARFVKSIDFATIRPTLSDWPTERVFEPVAIARESTGNLFVVDPTAGAIFVLTPALRVVRMWGGRGAGPGRFNHPTDLAFSPDGSQLYVVDSGNERVQVFDAACQPVTEFRVSADEKTHREPFGVTVGADGAVYVTDARRHSVQKFDKHGRWVKGWGTDGLGAGQLHRPRGLFFNANGQLIVIDHGNHRGEIFTSEGDYVDVFGAALFTEQAKMRRPTSQGVVD